MAKLGEILLKEGVLTSEQLKEALEIQKAKPNLFLGDILTRKGLLSEDVIVRALISQAGIPQANLDRIQLDSALSLLIPLKAAKACRAIPVKKNRNLLSVAMIDPLNESAISKLSQIAGCEIHPMVTTRKGLEKAWKSLYGNDLTLSDISGEIDSPSGNIPGQQIVQPSIAMQELDAAIDSATNDAIDLGEGRETRDRSPVLQLEISSEKSHVKKLVNSLILKAIKMRSSDIHVEPFKDRVDVRFRIDGALSNIKTLPKNVQNEIVSRIKIMSEMDIAERRKPQDGGFRAQFDKEMLIDFRVNTLPGINGEKVVLRILGQSELRTNVTELGFSSHNLKTINEAMNSPYGMILVTGPTGSGKTTTLYTILQQLNREQVNILTAEDPVEYQLDGITQVNIRQAIGFTFSMALRAFLRQDPDIIFVGEMRDYETTTIAVRAALTGHLILSSIHTNNCAATISRLVEMGIEPYLISYALRLIISQRLVRRICPNCKEELSLREAEKLNLDDSTLEEIEHLYRGKGCNKCNGIGFFGRAPVFEVLPIKSNEMRGIITEAGTEDQIIRVARKEGCRLLKDEAIASVNGGITTLEEAMKIIIME